MSDYVFLLQRDDGGPFLAVANRGPWLPSAAEAIVGDDLHPVDDEPGMWGTFDGHTTATRYYAEPVVTFSPDEPAPAVAP